MTEYFQKNLFYNISLEEYKHLLGCLDARERHFTDEETICTYDTFQSIGILGKGNALVVRYEINGARTILERLEPQDIFGHLLSAYQKNPLNGISVVSDGPCDVLFINYDGISRPCAKACTYHHQLIQNMLSLISEKAVDLSERVEVLSQRTIREKLTCYFLQLAGRVKSETFNLPFTMVDLADYLSIDRSAMTRELKRMKDEGIIEVNRRQIRLNL